MIVDTALGVLTAGVGTGVYAFLIRARFVVRAFRANNAFWPTAWGTADISWQTRADSLVVDLFALGIGTARRGLTGVHVGGGDGCIDE